MSVSMYRNIHKQEDNNNNKVFIIMGKDGSYYTVSANKASPVTL